MTISIEADKRGLIIRTPYSPMFVSELKRLIPAPDRQFDGQSKSWIVDPQHGPVIQKLIMTVYKEAVHIPQDQTHAYKTFDHWPIRVEYIGQCKQRSDGSISAYGHDGQSWAYILPESVLKSFFGQDVEISVEGDKSSNPVKSAPSTLYAALLLKADCGPVEVKEGYRRMSRLVHPDVNHEPDAHEQFLAIQRAYEILSDPIKRRRYDAGLALEASLQEKYKRPAPFGGFFSTNSYFRSPLRCGLLVVDGERKLGRVTVSKIHAWNDIQNEQGQTLVTSWPFGAETFERQWV